jgi:hypothetical protein
VVVEGSSVLIHVCSVKEEWKDKFAVTAEDYLHGLITLVNELVCLIPDIFVFRLIFSHCQSRLAVNAVTLGNFDEPIKISAFVKDLFAGFSMASTDFSKGEVLNTGFVA